jgi:hypothetical protein
LLENLFVSTEFGEYGVYACRFYKNGWKTVIVDDLIPCNAYTGYPIYSQNLNHSEIWVCILEKAYAKLHGSYENIDGGFINDGLLDLTGGTSDVLALPNRENKEVIEYIWTKITANYETGEALMGVLNKPEGSKPYQTGDMVYDKSSKGIVSHHAYSILDIKKIDNKEYIFLRNPWGRSSYTGSTCFSNVDFWTEDVKKILEYHHPQHDEGCFWMTKEDFFAEFNQFYVSHLIPKEFKTQIFKGKFDGSNSGGASIDPNFIDNPQYQINVSKKTSLIVSLHQPDARLSKIVNPKYEYKAFACYVVPNGKKGEKKIDEGIFKFIAPKSGNSLFKTYRDSDVEFELEASENPYVLIIAPDLPGRKGSYTLRLSSKEDIEVGEIKQNPKYLLKFDGRWANPLNGGCQNFYTWNQNPVYQLTVNSKSFVDIAISQPEENRWNAIGFNIYSKEIRGKCIKYSCKHYVRGAYFHHGLELIPEESPYFVMPCTFEPNRNVPYTLKFFAETKDSISVDFLSKDVVLDAPSTEKPMPPDFQKQIEECLKMNVCTFCITGKNFVNQKWFMCKDCDLSGNTGCCEVCANICHKGHQLEERNVSGFFCDCGAGEGKVKCKCLDFEKVKHIVKLTPKKQAEIITTPMVCNQKLLQELIAIGFEKSICEQALLKTGNNDLSKALDWVLKHNEKK